MASGIPPRRSPRNHSGEPVVSARAVSSPLRRTFAVAGIATCSSGTPSKQPKSPPAARWGAAACTVSSKSRGGGGEAEIEGAAASPANRAAPGGGIAGSPPGVAGNSPGSAKRARRFLVLASDLDPTAVGSVEGRESPLLATSPGSRRTREAIDLTTEDDGPKEDSSLTSLNSPRPPLRVLCKRKRMLDAVKGPVRRSPRTIASSPETPLVVAENGAGVATVKPAVLVAVESQSLRRSPRIISCSPSKSAVNYAGNADSDDDVVTQPGKKKKISFHPKGKVKTGVHCHGVFFVGDPVPEEEARSRWPHHYVQGRRRDSRIISKVDEDELVLGVKCHYYRASVVGSILNLGDCAYVKAEEGKPNYVGRILEFF